MDETRAREVASWWHGGQSSALYAFSSSGHVGEGLAGEIRQCQAEVKAHVGHYTQEDIRMLKGLAEYVESLPRPVHYHAGWNMVGYLPELDASYPFGSFQDAKRSMIDDMERFADNLDMVDDHDQANELSGVEQDLNLESGPEWGAIVGNMSYWIVECAESDCGEDEYV